MHPRYHVFILKMRKRLFVIEVRGFMIYNNSGDRYDKEWYSARVRGQCLYETPKCQMAIWQWGVV